GARRPRCGAPGHRGRRADGWILRHWWVPRRRAGARAADPRRDPAAPAGWALRPRDRPVYAESLAIWRRPVLTLAGCRRSIASTPSIAANRSTVRRVTLRSPRSSAPT